MIAGHVQDPHRQKMSKSKGNVVEPQDVIDQYSADAMRFWAAGSKLGDDLPFQEKDVATGDKMITKLWNIFQQEDLNMFFFCSQYKSLSAMDKHTTKSRVDASKQDECIVSK